MKRKKFKVLALAALLVMGGAFIIWLLPLPSSNPPSATDCDMRAQRLVEGEDWAYDNPADADRITDDCRPAHLLRK